MVTILVTGGAGFVGSHLVERLAADKNNIVLILDNFFRGAISNLTNVKNNQNIKIIKGDIRDPNTFKKLSKEKIGHIYHLAAQSNVLGSVNDPEYCISTNVMGTFNVLQFAVKSRVKSFFFFSSREVYGNPISVPVDETYNLNPINLYGATKASGEMLCKAFMKSHNLSITIIRLANVYGPRDKARVIPLFIDAAKNNKPLLVKGGKQVLDFVLVEDVIDAVVEIAKNDTYNDKTINVGSGKGISIQELAQLIVSLVKSKSKIVVEPARRFDVNSFVSKSNHLNLKITPLEVGLKKLLHSK